MKDCKLYAVARALQTITTVQYQHVQGHSGQPWNEAADVIANGYGQELHTEARCAPRFDANGETRGCDEDAGLEMGGTDPCWDHDDSWHATLGKRGLDHNTIGRPTCATTGAMARLFLGQRETEKTQ